MSHRRCIAMLAPCPFPTHQGTQVVIRNLAEGLGRAGHEVHLVTYGYGESELDSSNLSYVWHRAPTVEAGLRSGPSFKKPAANAQLLLHARRVIQTHGCELLHVHNAEGLVLGALLKLQVRLPVVYHAHTAMGPELPTYFRSHRAQAFAGWLGEVVDKTFPKMADAVIVFDEENRRLHEDFGVEPQRLFTIPPGFVPEELGNASKRDVELLRGRLGPGPVVLYAGNPDGYQNLSLLWDAFRLVRSEMPRAKLLIATSHPESSFAVPLASATHRAGVVVHRYRSLRELRAIFALARVGVCTRRISAGAPVKVLNYMAAGIPTVACRSAVTSLLNDESGTSVDPDPEQMASACLRYLSLRRLPRRQIRRQADRFRVDGHIPAYEGVYGRVLRRRY